MCAPMLPTEFLIHEKFRERFREFPIVKDTASDITTPRLYNIKSTPKLLISKIGACFHI